MSKPTQGHGFFGPFRVAMGGVIYTFRTQRHMRFHLYVVIVTILLGLFFNLPLRQLLILLFTISLVLVAEMFNSAIEATVDLVQPTYHPLARFAKDIAAGAVLITTVLALIVGSLMLIGEQRFEEIRLAVTGEAIQVPIVGRLVLGLFIAVLCVIIGKGLGSRGTVLRGGLVSGHTAIGFFLAGALFFLTESALANAIAVILAAMIAESRWEAKIHSLLELTLGATVGVLLALFLFGLVPK